MNASPYFHFGRVIHHRYAPDNRFSYRVFYLRIPMRTRSKQPDLLSKLGIGDNQFSILSFYDEDHGIANLKSLDWIESFLNEQGITNANGEIWLHTFPRVFGYVFNPVSFWFCHDINHHLVAIIAEVNNTFGGRHAYLLHDNNAALVWGQNFASNKLFYVSPFFEVKGSYQFRFMRQEQTQQSRHVSRIDYFEDDKRVLMTSISGKEYPIDAQSKRRALLNYPLLTLGIIAKIHWQALRLWLKGTKFIKNPA